MHKRLSAVGAGIAAVAVVATSFLGGASANATVTPPYEPDAYSLGGLTLRDAAGAVVTSGSLAASPIAAYAVASGTTTDAGSHAFAHLQLATPNGTPNTYAYNTEPLGADSSYPVAAPASVAAAGANVPVASGTAGDLSFATYIGDFPNSQTGSYANLYQLRLYTPSTSAVTPSAKYFSVDLQVDPATSTWTVVYPAAKTATSVSAITASPVSPADPGSNVTLSTTVTAADGSHPAGTVSWFDGTTALSGGTFDAATGAAGISLTGPATGSHSYTARFTPTDTTTYNGGTSAALPYTVNGVGSTAVGLSVDNVAGTAGTAVTFTAAVTPTPAGSPAGTVRILDGTTLVGSSSTAVANVYTVSKASGFPVGAHSFTATFTPSSPAVWGGPVTSAAVGAAYTAPVGNTTDPQAVTVTVPSNGTLTISTPYTASHPFDLGTMTLDPNGLYYSASAAFGSTASAPLPTVDPAATPAVSNGGVNGGVAIVDTRAGDLGWTASVVADAFTDGGTNAISPENLAFTGVVPGYVPGNKLQPGSVTTHELGSNWNGGNGYAAGATGNDGLGARRSFADAAAGLSVGSVYVDGTLTLRAPTSTPAGLYSTTLTFTIA
jgi:hypothetical protein